MAGGAPPADGGAEERRGRTPTGKRAPDSVGQLFGTLRSDDEPEECDREIRRVPHLLRHVEDSGGALLHVDGRFPAIGAH